MLCLRSNHFVKIPIILFLQFFLSSCNPVHYGNVNSISSQFLETITPGKSSKYDLYNALGQPADVISADESTVWIYVTTEVSGNLLDLLATFTVGQAAKVTTNSFEFDEKGVLTKRLQSIEKTRSPSTLKVMNNLVQEGEKGVRVRAELNKLGLHWTARN